MMKKILSYIIILVLGIVIGLLCRVHHFRDTTQMVQTDTLWMHDTITIEKPVPIEQTRKDTLLVEVHDTTRIHDTLYVALPMESKTYKGEDYLAEISGYNASLDRIEVYPKQVVISKTETTTEYLTKKNAIGVGLEVNYITSPYIPIYLEYSHLLHENVNFYARLVYDIPSKSYGVGAGVKATIGW